jgi:hypothetical protein
MRFAGDKKMKEAWIEERGRDSQKVWEINEAKREFVLITLDGVIASVLRSEIDSKILRRCLWKFVPPLFHFAGA